MLNSFLSRQVVYGVGCAAFAALWHALAADTPAGWPSGSGSSGSGAQIPSALSARSTTFLQKCIALGLRAWNPFCGNDYECLLADKQTTKDINLGWVQAGSGCGR